MTPTTPLGVSPTVIAAVGIRSAATIFISAPDGRGLVFPDQISSVLLLSGRHPPLFTDASLIDSGLGAQGRLPTPIPEPSTGAIALLALFTFGISVVIQRNQRLFPLSPGYP